jgi:hypothetical protein
MHSAIWQDSMFEFKLASLAYLVDCLKQEAQVVPVASQLVPRREIPLVKHVIERQGQLGRALKSDRQREERLCIYRYAVVVRSADRGGTDCHMLGR